MNKKGKKILGIAIIGLGTAIGIHICSPNEFHMAEGAQIVRHKSGEGGYQIKLQAKTDYGEKVFSLNIVPMSSENENLEKKQKEDKTTSEQQFFELLEQEVRRRNKDHTEQQMISLPESYQGIPVTWHEIREPQEIYILLLTVVGMLLVAYCGEKEDKKKQKNREKMLRAVYAAFVEKLRLYLIAGLSTRNAFFTITKQYAAQKHLSKGEKYLFEELSAVCNKLQNGIREEEAYTEWGNRCREMSYRKLSFLLVINLKRGNQEMLESLHREVRKIQDMQREQTKKQGEEAATKLLFPMVLLLVVVMILVICPAYSRMGGI